MGKASLLTALVSVFALVSLGCSAATISGTIYDLGLEEVKNAVVFIDTEPRQQIVSKNGTYSFNVEAGNYLITAKKYSGSEVALSAEEKISVAKEGAFVLDIILFPSFEEEEQILSDSNLDIEAAIEGQETSYIALAALAIAVIAFFLILRMKGKEIAKRRGELEDDEKGDIGSVMEFIREQGGRTTQKEVRKNFPQSEAKISLIISELEEKGKIRKIKKGRGNIIVLNR